MKNLKTTRIENLSLNLQDPTQEDIVHALNMVAEQFGGVKNMGVFADITAITPMKEMKADISDSFIEIHTQDKEQPFKKLENKNNIKSPFDLDYDILIGKQI